MARMEGTSDRISYMGQASGEYYIYLDGKFYCSSDTYSELREDIKELDKMIDNGEI